MLSTSGFVDHAMFSYHGANGPESSVTLYIEEIRQSGGRTSQAVTAFGRDCGTGIGAKSAMYDCLVGIGVF